MSSEPDVPPVAADRPVVDGTQRSSEDLRAEVDRHGDGEIERDNARLREEVGETARELAARLDVRERSRNRAAQVRGAAVAHPGVLAGSVAVVVFAVVLRRVRGEVRAR